MPVLSVSLTFLSVALTTIRHFCSSFRRFAGSIRHFDLSFCRSDFYPSLVLLHLKENSKKGYAKVIHHLT
ncbi:hypothetical protein [Lysinibacillus sp. TE18511]